MSGPTTLLEPQADAFPVVLTSASGEEQVFWLDLDFDTLTGEEMAAAVILAGANALVNEDAEPAPTPVGVVAFLYAKLCAHPEARPVPTWDTFRDGLLPVFEEAIA